MNNKKNLPNIAKFVIAIIESQLSKLIGDDAIEILKSPLLTSEDNIAIIAALKRTEIRFVKKYPDQSIIDAVENLPIAELPSAVSAVRSFYENSDKEVVLDVLQKNLRDILPKRITNEQIILAANTFCQILLEELIGLPSIRRRLIGLSSIKIEQETQEISKILSNIEQLLYFSINQEKIEEVNTITAKSKVQPLLSEIHNAEKILIGHKLNSTAQVNIPISQIRKHILLLGSSGAGKTYTIHGLLDNLWHQYKIPFLYCHDSSIGTSIVEYFEKKMGEENTLLTPEILKLNDDGDEPFYFLKSVISKMNCVHASGQLKLVIVFEDFIRMFHVGTGYYGKRVKETNLFIELMIRARRCGIGLILSSSVSGPINMEIVRNLRNFLIFRTFNKDTITPLMNITDITENHIMSVYQLRMGQALLYSGGIMLPTFVKIPQRDNLNFFSSYH